MTLHIGTDSTPCVGIRQHRIAIRLAVRYRLHWRHIWTFANSFCQLDRVIVKPVSGFRVIGFCQLGGPFQTVFVSLQVVKRQFNRLAVHCGQRDFKQRRTLVYMGAAFTRYLRVTAKLNLLLRLFN